MSGSSKNILVIDDEQHQLDTICRGLRLYGYRCKGVLSVEAALAELTTAEAAAYDLVITDLTMPGRSGLELITRVQSRWPALPIVVITGLADTAEVALVRQMKVPYLRKPFLPDALDATIRRALELSVARAR